MKRRHTAVAWLVTTVFATTAVAAVPSAAFAAASVDYVAMGDSYAAGLGAGGSWGLCMRGPNGYPQLWANAHKPATFQNVACSGATTSDVWRDQLDVLDGRTDLISLTIGGNDSGFAPAVISCTVGTDSFCLSVIDAARDFITEDLPGELNDLYAEISDRAPKAKVVVLGYPRLFDAKADCGWLGMSTTKRSALNKGADDMNTVIKTAAKKAGFTFVDVRSAFDKHGICSPSAWLNPLLVFAPFDSFHPTATGYKSGYYPAFDAVTG